MTQYTWAIKQLDCIPSIDGQNNIVSNIHWRVKGDDGTNTTEIYGTQGISPTVTKGFIPYETLKEEKVIYWVQDAMGIDAVTKLQEAIDKQLEMIANPPVITPALPWAN